MPRRDIEDVNVTDPHGDPFLGGHGIGHANVNTVGAITLVDCGIFAVQKPIPQVGKQYVITGNFADQPRVPFRVTLTCNAAARPSSQFT